MEALLTFLVKKVTGIKDFKIAEENEGEPSNYMIHAPQDSLGLIIGKGGKTIKALRNILKVRATLEKKRVNLSVTPIIEAA